jgi:hypothetical protein
LLSAIPGCGCMTIATHTPALAELSSCIQKLRK